MEGAPKFFRCVTQRCESAKLLIDNNSEYVHIGRGLILYVSWAKGASIQDLPKIVKNLLNMRLLPSSTGKNLSICEASMENGPAHLLVIPQAALTSKLQRGKNIQYVSLSISAVIDHLCLDITHN
ncbi:D-tyrosyl-tRNA(Tyr) deacylase [Aphanomyces cochlioides]|nr:D-tyrosyl-tRNA(Tyr) deacylase [Aphanomyces cochlioides]